MVKNTFLITWTKSWNNAYRQKAKTRQQMWELYSQIQNSKELRHSSKTFRWKVALWITSSTKWKELLTTFCQQCWKISTKFGGFSSTSSKCWAFSQRTQNSLQTSSIYWRNMHLVPTPMKIKDWAKSLWNPSLTPLSRKSKRQILGSKRNVSWKSSMIFLEEIVKIRKQCFWNWK